MTALIISMPSLPALSWGFHLLHLYMKCKLHVPWMQLWRTDWQLSDHNSLSLPLNDVSKCGVNMCISIPTETHRTCRFSSSHLRELPGLACRWKPHTCILSAIQVLAAKNATRLCQWIMVDSVNFGNFCLVFARGVATNHKLWNFAINDEGHQDILYKRQCLFHTLVTTLFFYCIWVVHLMIAGVSFCRSTYDSMSTLGFEYSCTADDLASGIQHLRSCSSFREQPSCKSYAGVICGMFYS